jgi:antibiotic biosynthesis monooxygenase (ABM) superfamily enzyme
MGTTAMSQRMSPPPIHIRAVITWIAIFPLVTIGSFAIAPFASDWNPVLRAFVLSTFVVPLAVYLVVPRLTRAYAKLRQSWTPGRPTPRRSDSINVTDGEALRREEL